jgi:aspartyl-tRNA(Asn)/glutamyl-tRNA(Gln) amidotransferase subunit A
MYGPFWKDVFANSANTTIYSAFVEAENGDLNLFLEFDPYRTHSAEKSGLLAGVPFAVKDNIAVQGFHNTCGSRMLENLVAPYTATAVRKLLEAGARVVGKTNLDEFGMGSTTEHSFRGPSRNPFDVERVTGGSSGGSAAAVAAGLVPFALGSDTGGSIRQPASYCGVYGLKPTYGSVSRYGLVAYASSLEVIGVVAESVSLAESVFATMRGQDEMDHSSISYPKQAAERLRVSAESREDEVENGNTVTVGEEARQPHGSQSGEAARQAANDADSGDGPLRVGVLKQELQLDPAVERVYRETQERLASLGFEIVEVELPMLDYVVPVYYTIATAEASANLARFNGVRYGYRPEDAENPEELVRKARDESFGDEVKMRILLGTYVLRSGFQDEYYIRAQKIRTAIRNDFVRCFESADLLLTPVSPGLPPKLGEQSAFEQKVADLFTSAVNLAGIPALSFPAGMEGRLPVGMQLIAPQFREDRLFAAGRRFEREVPRPVPAEHSGLPAWSARNGKQSEWAGQPMEAEA